MGSSTPPSPAAPPAAPALEALFWFWSTLRLALLAIRLLYAGHPLHPSAPPVPLQRPPPGHVPFGVRSAATYFAPAVVLVVVVVVVVGDGTAWATAAALGAAGDVRSGLGVAFGTVVGGRFRFVGRAAFLAFRYRPQALQMVAPCGDLRQRGVRLVPQLLKVRLVYLDGSDGI